MKNIIIILATIILGAYIGTTLINGPSGSLKTGASNIVTEANVRMTELIDHEN